MISNQYIFSSWRFWKCQCIFWLLIVFAICRYLKNIVTCYGECRESSTFEGDYANEPQTEGKQKSKCLPKEYWRWILVMGMSNHVVNVKKILSKNILKNLWLATGALNEHFLLFLHVWTFSTFFVYCSIEKGGFFNFLNLCNRRNEHITVKKMKIRAPGPCF